MEELQFVKISELSEAIELNETDIVTIVQDGTTRRAFLGEVIALAKDSNAKILWDAIEGKPSVFKPEKHTHDASEITNLEKGISKEYVDEEIAKVSEVVELKADRVELNNKRDKDVKIVMNDLSEEVKDAIDNATGGEVELAWDNITGKPSVFKPEEHTHTGYASENHTHTGYANEKHTHTEYADKTHAHSEYANKTHTHNYEDIIGIPEGGTGGTGGTECDVNKAYVDGEISKVNTKLESKREKTDKISLVELKQDVIDYIDNSGTGGTVTEVTWDSIKNKPTVFKPDTHAHTEYAQNNHTHTGYATTTHKHNKVDVEGLVEPDVDKAYVDSQVAMLQDEIANIEGGATPKPNYVEISLVDGKYSLTSNAETIHVLKLTDDGILTLPVGEEIYSGMEIKAYAKGLGSLDVNLTFPDNVRLPYPEAGVIQGTRVFEYIFRYVNHFIGWVVDVNSYAGKPPKWLFNTVRNTSNPGTPQPNKLTEDWYDLSIYENGNPVEFMYYGELESPSGGDYLTIRFSVKNKSTGEERIERVYVNNTSGGWTKFDAYFVYPGGNTWTWNVFFRIYDQNGALIRELKTTVNLRYDIADLLFRPESYHLDAKDLPNWQRFE